MTAQERVLTLRRELVRLLCRSGSSESLESVLDILLSEEHFSWEDYQNVLVLGRPLHTNARQLLDLACAKGEETCRCLLSALEQVQPKAYASVGVRDDEGCAQTCTNALVTQRARLVRELKDSVDGVLEELLASGYFTPADCEAVKRPNSSSSQQVRTLLDHVQTRGESAAEVVLRCSGQPQTSRFVDGSNVNFPQDFFRYQSKLRSSVLAQSLCVGTYGGSSHMYLDDIYTEGRLELPDGGVVALEGVVRAAGTVNSAADTVLISGYAGSGKSTLLQRMHLLWARGAMLQDFLLLFPFSCRKFNSEGKELSLVDLLFHHCCWPDRDKDDIFQFILDNPHLILFTFDGLDELKETFTDEQRLCCPTQRAPVSILLFNLLQGNLMKGVRKIVSSRPEAVSPALKKNLREEVILKGFSPSCIDSFVRKHHKESPVAMKVLQSLKTNRALLGLCHSPVLCWIVSQCHKQLLDGTEESPKTITHVYLMILQHFLQRQSSADSTDGFSWFLQHHTTVLHLGQLAFEGVGCSVYVFSRIELNKCGVTEMDIDSGFLMQSKDVHSGSLFSDTRTTYEFLHVTIQCFFAAVYVVMSTNIEKSAISQLFKTQNREVVPCGHVCFFARRPSSVQQKQILDKDSLESKHQNLQITAMFLCGLLSHRYQCIWLQCCSSDVIEKKAKHVTKCLTKALQKHFKSIPQPVQGEKKSMHAMPGFVWLMKCTYEMQDSAVAKDAMSKMDVQHLKLTYCNIGPVECTALAYVLQHLKNPVGLQLDDNLIGDVGVEQLLPCLHVCQSLYLRNNNISDEGIIKVITRAIHCENFQKIALYNNKLTDACTKDLSELLKAKQNFLALRLGNNKISTEGAIHLAEGLRQNHSLQYLGLWGNNVGDAGACALACALESSQTLVWLSLVGNEVGCAGARALSNVIKNCKSLEDIWLSDNHITRPGVEYLIEALQQNASVKSIGLKNNDLTKEDEEEIKKQEPRLTF